MRRLRFALPALALSGLLALGAGETVLACLPSDGEAPEELLSGPVELKVRYYTELEERWQLDAELEGQIIIEQPDQRSPALLSSDRDDESTVLLVLLALAAPLFAAASVGAFALRSRRR